MSETSPEASEQAAAEQPCTDCVTGGEKILAGLAVLFAVFIIVMAADMFTGGKLTGSIGVKGGG